MLTRIALYCGYCRRSKPVSDFSLKIDRSGIYMCDVCWERHGELLDALAGSPPPKECQMCQAPFLEGERLYMHHVDGIYQLVCRGCSDGYARKRADLFRATPFGATAKI